MTIVLRMPDGVPLTAQQERQAWGAVHGGGSGRQLGGRSGFRVGTPSNVLTATSTTWTLGACSAMLDPGAQTHQGMYGWSSDGNVTGTVTAADATYDRKDIVYIQVNDSDMDTSGAKSAPVLYLAGAPSATPAAPSLPPRSFLVGTITVPKAGGGSPTVVRNPAVYVAAGGVLPISGQAEEDEIAPFAHDGMQISRTDKFSVRRWANAGAFIGGEHAEFTGSTQLPATPAVWGVGALAKDTSQSVFDGAITSPGNDAITLPAGRWLFIARLRMSVAATTQTYASLRNSSDPSVYTEYDSCDLANGTSANKIVYEFYNTAPRTVYLRFYSGNTNQPTLTSRIIVSRAG